MACVYKPDPRSKSEFVSHVKSFTALSDVLGDEWHYCEQSPLHHSYLKKSIYHETAEGRLKAEYIVSYSVSYAMPLFSFNVWRSTGALLPLEEFIELISKVRVERHSELRSMITQQEHPVLRRPYYTLHPCRTAAWLGSVAHTSHNLLVTFLSAVAPLVGLYMNLKYADVDLYIKK